MSYTTYYRWGWGVALTALTLASLACSAIGNAIDNNPVVATAQSVATQTGELGGLAQTAEAMATEANVNGLSATAEALATEANAGGLSATAEAMATEAGGADVQATAEAIATQALAGLGDVPPDIPIVPGETTNFFGTKDVVSYGTALDFKAVLDFYQKGMAKSEWQPLETLSVVTADAAVLQYDKPQRTAIVTLSKDSVSGQTYVQILIQPK